MPGPKGTVRNPLMMCLYTWLTCGIFLYWYYYAISKELKDFTGDEEINPTTTLLLSVLLGCLGWAIASYKVCKSITIAQKVAGLPEEDKSTLCLILGLLCLYPFVPYIVQGQLNQIWEAGGGAAPAVGAPPAAGAPYQPPMPGVGG